MYRHIQDFIADWQEEAKMTVTIFKAVTDNRKGERPNENLRSLERLAWHITQTLTEMPHKAGLLESDALDHQPAPATMQEITDTYKQHSHALIEALGRKWNEASLEEEVNMYGSPWSKSKILSVLIRHQIHHRGQMTTLMRVLDMKVPGIYGPSKEEWVQYGMPVMD